MPTTDDIILNLARRPVYTNDVRRDIDFNFVAIKEIIVVLDAGQGISDTFTTTDGKTVTVVGGVITGIV